MATLYLKRFIPFLGILLFESPGLCQKVSYQDGLRAALEKNDIKRCDRITEGITIGDVGPSLDSARLTCKTQLAIARKDPSLCEQVANGPDMSPRTFCYRRLAQSLRRPELCEKITPENAVPKLILTFRDQCRLQAIAEPSQCVEGFHNTAASAIQSLKNHDQCLWITATNGLDTSLCEQLDSEIARKNCLEDVTRLRAEEARLAVRQEFK